LYQHIYILTEIIELSKHR